METRHRPSRPKHRREALREEVHGAVVEIAQTLLDQPGSGSSAAVSGRPLDQLHDRALRVLYRLVITSKAESERLLPGRPSGGSQLPPGVCFDREPDNGEIPEELAHGIRGRLADIDLHDLGPIYESLLDRRLAAERSGGRMRLSLENRTGSRKASGAYFTPDALVDPLVRQAIEPLLHACGPSAERVLGLRVIDPSMGAGVFLVKAVDVIARHLLLHCEPPDRDAPMDRGPGDLAYWKRQVAEHCIYGVDADPTAVELARAILWLHCADRGKAPERLHEHLKCGDSLVGAPIDRLATPGLSARKRRGGWRWEARNQPAPEDPRGDAILACIQETLDRSGSSAGERTAAHKLLCDLWCAQWFVADSTAETFSAYEDPSGLYERVKAICSTAGDPERQAELERLQAHPLVRRIRQSEHLPRFFHWPIEFPEIAWSSDGRLKPGGGFDVVLGNPPWDKIKPARRDFYSPFDAEVKSTQGPSLDALIAHMESQRPGLRDRWIAYEQTVRAYAGFLAESGIYSHQMAVVDGSVTGGDPDLFRYFVERSVERLKPGGMLGLVVPCTLWAAEGCTALRRLLFEDCTIQRLYTFENYRKWAFGIHPSFKFTMFTAKREPAPETRHFPSAFMLREPAVIEKNTHKRIVHLSRRFVYAVSPKTKALLDLRTEIEARLVERIHAAHPTLGDPASDWNVRYDRELDMTVDSWLFKRREWMQARGFTRVLGGAASIPGPLPPGGEYWVASSPEYYRRQGYLERQGEIAAGACSWFVHPEDARRAADKPAPAPEAAFRIVPGGYYTALYEGRMVHLFDPSQKGYVTGEGRRAQWDDIPFDDKLLRPRVFLCPEDAGIHRAARVGFCDVTGATNERTLLACLIPAGVACGNTVPILHQDDPEDALLLLGILGSFVADFLARLRVSTHLNWTYVASIPLPCKRTIPEPMRRTLVQTAARLSCTLPELAGAWRAVFPDIPWTTASAERDLRRRANLRATLDALVAELYGLSAAEYGYLLTTFPLLDRDQPALPGDAFVTEGHERSRRRGAEGQDWEERPWGVLEKRPRSFVTRDLALLTFMQHVKHAAPEQLDEWYRGAAGIDPEGEISRFRIGEIKDLATRVGCAAKLGAVAYVPSSRRQDSSEPREQD